MSSETQISDHLNTQPNTSKVLPQIAMTYLQQTGEIFVGKNSRQEAMTMGLCKPKLKKQQQKDLKRAKNFAHQESLRYGIMKYQIDEQQKSRKITVYAQAFSMMSRVYVGNISYEMTDLHVREIFGVFGDIRHIHVSFEANTEIHKGFAFIEYENPEAARLCVDSMDGIFIYGRVLKVNMEKPLNFEAFEPLINNIMEDAKKFHRIYIASIASDVSQEELITVFQCFGQIKYCKLAKQVGCKGHRGYGYIEFTTANAAEEALSMNKLELCGETLRVGKCVTPPDAVNLNIEGQGPTVPAMPTQSAQNLRSAFDALKKIQKAYMAATGGT